MPEIACEDMGSFIKPDSLCQRCDELFGTVRSGHMSHHFHDSTAELSLGRTKEVNDRRKAVHYLRDGVRIPSWLFRQYKYKHPNRYEPCPEQAKQKISASLKGREHSAMCLLRSKEHNQAVLDESEEFRRQGFKVIVTDKIRPDFVARKENMIYAVEVEFSDHPDYQKYQGQTVFDDVIWIKKEHKVGLA